MGFSLFQNSPNEKPMRPSGVDTPIPRITMRSLVMALFVSIGVSTPEGRMGFSLGLFWKDDSTGCWGVMDSP
jgi:hypothetical protein